MEPWQLRRIRDGLKAFKTLGSDSGGNAFSWRSIEEAIQHETGVSVPEARLSKFVIGEPHRDPDKKQYGIRHYPKLSDERLEAVITFLTDPESSGYTFSREDLDIYSSELLGPLRLMEYLNDTRADTRFLTPTSLSGHFVGRQNVDGNQVTVSIRFREASYEGMVQFVLFKSSSDDFLIPDVAEDPIEVLAQNSKSVVRYDGWAILTPEENICLMAKKERNGENLIYLTLGIDNKAYEKKPMQAFVVLEHDFPEDTVDIKQDGNEEELKSTVLEAWKDRVVLFSRQAEKAT